MIGIVNLKSGKSLIDVNNKIPIGKFQNFLNDSINGCNDVIDTLLLFKRDNNTDTKSDGLIINDKAIVWNTLSDENNYIVKDCVNRNPNDVQARFNTIYFPLNTTTSKLFKKKRFDVAGKDFFDLQQEILVMQITIEMMIQFENPQPYILKFLEFSGVIPTIIFLDITLKKKLIGAEKKEEVEMKQQPRIEGDITETLLKGVKLPFSTTEIRLIPKKRKWEGLRDSIEIYFKKNPPTVSTLIEMVDMFDPREEEFFTTTSTGEVVLSEKANYKFKDKTWEYVLNNFTRFIEAKKESLKKKQDRLSDKVENIKATSRFIKYEKDLKHQLDMNEFSLIDYKYYNSLLTKTKKKLELLKKKISEIGVNAKIKSVNNDIKEYDNKIKSILLGMQKSNKIIKKLKTENKSQIKEVELLEEKISSLVTQEIDLEEEKNLEPFIKKILEIKEILKVFLNSIAATEDLIKFAFSELIGLAVERGRPYQKSFDLMKLFFIKNKKINKIVLGVVIEMSGMLRIKSELLNLMFGYEHLRVGVIKGVCGIWGENVIAIKLNTLLEHTLLKPAIASEVLNVILDTPKFTVNIHDYHINVFEKLLKFSKKQFNVTFLRNWIGRHVGKDADDPNFFKLLSHLSKLDLHHEFIFNSINIHFETMIPWSNTDLDLEWFWDNFKDKFDPSFENNKFLKKIVTVGDMRLFSLFLEDKRVLSKLSNEEIKKFRNLEREFKEKKLKEKKEKEEKEKKENEEFLESFHNPERLGFWDL